MDESELVAKICGEAVEAIEAAHAAAPGGGGALTLTTFRHVLLVSPWMRWLMDHQHSFSPTARCGAAADKVWVATAAVLRSNATVDVPAQSPTYFADGMGY